MITKELFTKFIENAQAYQKELDRITKIEEQFKKIDSENFKLNSLKLLRNMLVKTFQ